MLRIRTVTAIALVLSLGAGAVHAQSLRNADAPAEFPPSSFTGKQYVDSKGCVFIRAGFDGAVTWVPRVSRKRKVLCGFTPTFAGRSTPREAPVQVASAPAPKPVAAPVRVQAKPRPAPVRTATVPTRVAPVSAPVTVRTRPRPGPVIAQAAPVRVRPAPVRIQTAPPAPLRSTPTGIVCPGASATSQKYLRSTDGRPVRCGPQSDHPSNYATQGVAGGTRYAAASGAIRVPPPPKIAPPPGYKPAFEDDRFNPYRGQQTREGFVQMRLAWTSGVPRRLYDQNTGRVVNKLFPNLRYPFTSMQQQRRYVAVNAPVVSAKNTPPASNVRVSTKAQPPAQAAPPRQTPVRVAKPTPAAPSGHRYVQVGTFGVESNARNTAARLAAMGVPAKLASYSKGGKVYRVVLAGPYRDAGALQNALAAVRRAGFSDAYTRK